MVELWATFKIWIEYIIPISIFVLMILIAFLYVLIKSFKWSRKEKYLKRHGYVRYLKSVSSFGSGTFYGWKNDDVDKRIDEREIEHLSYKQFMNKMKG